jgi:hypothetical protein
MQLVSKQQIGKHASITIDLLLETVFCIRSMQNIGGLHLANRVEVGSNTSTVSCESCEATKREVSNLRK